jgi:hypothetical protein
MKKILLLTLAIISFSCNMSDQEYILPSKYVFIKEGGSSNIVLRNHKLIIDHGAVDFTYNEKFIFFSVDTTFSMEPKKVSKEKLIYYVHNIQKDTFSKPINYNYIINIISKNKIENKNNILLKY